MKDGYQSNPIGEQGREPNRTSLSPDNRNKSQGQHFQGN